MKRKLHAWVVFSLIPRFADASTWKLSWWRSTLYSMPKPVDVSCRKVANCPRSAGSDPPWPKKAKAAAFSSRGITTVNFNPALRRGSFCIIFNTYLNIVLASPKLGLPLKWMGLLPFVGCLYVAFWSCNWKGFATTYLWVFFFQSKGPVSSLVQGVSLYISLSGRVGRLAALAAVIINGILIS